MTRMTAFSLLMAGSFTLLAGSVLAQDAPAKAYTPLAKTVGQVSQQEPVASLLVINSDGVKLEGDKLILTGISTNSIVFSERPTRAAGHIATDEIVKQWGVGPDSFDNDPPNATVSVLGSGSDVSDAVVTLKSPKLDGTTLTFDVTVLEGSLSGASGPAAVFIDYWRGWHHAGWYALGAATGFAIGAEMAGPRYQPYYPPAYGRPCPPGFWIGPWGHCRDTPYHGRLPDGQWQ